MTKQYENGALKGYFEKYIGQMSVGNQFKPLLVDVLLRRSYQYNLTPEEIQTDMEALINNLDKIEYKSFEPGTTMGRYYQGDQKIEINKNSVGLQDLEGMYETLTHEVYHALTKEIGTPQDKLGGTNQFTGIRNSILLEAFVEKAAYKTVYGTQQKNIYNYVPNYNSNGYSDIIFIVDAIEATYGVNEQAILRNGIQSREQLAKFLGSSIGEDPSDAMKFLDQIEIAYNELYNTRYGEQTLKPQEEGTDIATSLYMLKITCMEKMGKRLELCKPKDMEEMADITGRMKFDINKLNFIFDERGEFFDSVLLSKYNQNFNINEMLKAHSGLQSRLVMNSVDEVSQILRCSR